MRSGISILEAVCVLVCVAGIAIGCLTGCAEVTPFKFEAGEIVQHMLDGRVGIVTSRHHSFGRGGDNTYYVRFSVLIARTDVRLLGPDGVVKAEPYCEVKCMEFELKKKED